MLLREVDEAVLREIYLKPFELAVKAEPYMVMTSYNLVNGVRMSENADLIRVLRKELGFEGVIVTDWEACKDAEAGIKAGTTMIFPFNEDRQRELEKIIESHSVPDETVDEAAQKYLNLHRNASGINLSARRKNRCRAYGNGKRHCGRRCCSS